MNRRARRWLGTGGLVALALYLAVLGGLYLVQDRLFYPGWWRGTRDYPIEGSGYRSVPLRTSDGSAGRLLYHPAAAGRPVVLFLHGNGDNATSARVILERFVAAGYGAAIPEYRGYDGLPGIPEEQGLYRDARAGRDWLTAQGIGADHIVVIGYSLGTGIAVQLAAEQRPRALVLMAPYAGMADVVRRRIPWIPGFLVTERFDSAAKIGRIACPILLLHGADGTTVPTDSSRLLLAGAAGCHTHRVPLRRARDWVSAAGPCVDPALARQRRARPIASSP